MSHDEVVSYAQNWEDLILHTLLFKVDQGFYVDVGANHPTTDSVTKYFYDQGWHGVNIEPNAKLAELLRQERPKDVVVEKGVSAQPGEMMFYNYTDRDGWSTFSPQVAEANQSENLATQKQTIPVTTLKDVFDEYRPTGDIDFLKIDVEGLEYEVIEGNDWQKYRPKILVIEANHIERDWHPLLEQARYKKVFFDGLNEYFASEEYAPQIDFSVYPKVTTERGAVISYQQLLRREHILQDVRHEYEQKITNEQEQCAAARKEIDAVRKELAVAKEQRDHVANELEWGLRHPFKFAVAKFYHYHVKKDYDIAKTIQSNGVGKEE